MRINKDYVFVLIIIFLLLEISSYFLYDNTQFFISDANIGWKHKSNLNTKFNGMDFTSKIHTNAEGFADFDHSVSKNLTRIAFLGDSFTEAWQVDFNESFPRLIEKNLSNIEILNFGVSSFGTDQELLTYKKYVQKYSPDIVVLVFSNNDVRDNYKILYDKSSKIDLMKNKPFFHMEENGKLTEIDFIEYKKSLLKSFLGKSYFLSLINNFIFTKKIVDKKLPEGYDLFFNKSEGDWSSAWNITLRVIEEFKKETSENNQMFIFVIGVDKIQVSSEEQKNLVIKYPESKNIVFDFEKPTNILKEFCTAEEILCVNLYKEFKNHGENLFVVDGHWNAQGHALVADILSDKIKSLKVYEPLI